MDDTTVVVIGGGIAGVSAAYWLARHPSAPAVTLIEAEGQLAHHATGRSAAQLIETYGTKPTRSLTTASLDFFDDPPQGLTDSPLVTPRGLLSVAGPGQEHLVDVALAEGRVLDPSITEVDAAEAVRLFPYLRPERVARGVYEPDSRDIDVASVHQAFVRGARQAGATIATDQRASGIEGGSGPGAGWTVTTASGDTHGADLVVNAAGAWGDEVARLAGIEPLGLRPLRRTAFMINAPAPEQGLEPLTADIEHRWYTKRDGAQLLCSPADETPSEPCDAKPEEIDIALAIERINEATTLGIRSVGASWAGLRTFSPDDTMVLGPDPGHPGFVWSVGQGGVGIQTSPGAGRLVADLALDGQPGQGFRGIDLDLASFLPNRFR